MTPLEQLAEQGLAAHRITRLVTTDVITDQPRIWAAQKLGGFPVAQGLKCDWCVGMWIGLGLVVLDRVDPPGWRLLRRGLAVADLVGIIAGSW